MALTVGYTDGTSDERDGGAARKGWSRGWLYHQAQRVPLPEGATWVSLPAVRHRPAVRRLTESQQYTGTISAATAATRLDALLREACDAGAHVQIADPAEVLRAWEQVSLPPRTASAVAPQPLPAPAATRYAPMSRPLPLGRPIVLAWIGEERMVPGRAPALQIVLCRSVINTLYEGHTSAALVAVRCVEHALEDFASLLDLRTPMRPGRRGPPRPAQVWRLYVQTPSGVEASQVVATRELEGGRAQRRQQQRATPRERLRPIRRTVVFMLWLIVRLARLGYAAGQSAAGISTGDGNDHPTAPPGGGTHHRRVG